MEAYNFKMTVPGVGDLPAGNLMTSRGCPFTCNFCATPTNWGTNVRGLTPQNVVREIEHLIERYGVQGDLVLRRHLQLQAPADASRSWT